jgi:hypothetical protein
MISARAQAAHERRENRMDDRFHAMLGGARIRREKRSESVGGLGLAEGIPETISSQPMAAATMTERLF